MDKDFLLQVSGLYEAILEKVFSLLKKGGSLYYQSLDRKETKEEFVGGWQATEKSTMKRECLVLRHKHSLF